MEKEFKVNGKVTYPQGTSSRTTYTLIDNAGNMITLNADTNTDFDYGDAVVMTLEKKSATTTTADNVSGSVLIQASSVKAGVSTTSDKENCVGVVDSSMTLSDSTSTASTTSGTTVEAETTADTTATADSTTNTETTATTDATKGAD